jgi:NAD(P)-dependent dehydrogenase (short-subunit alcohol dehydrogenase family)
VTGDSASPKIVLITGATGGIGKVTALELARAGYQVLLTSRDASKGQAVLQELQMQNRSTIPEVYLGDLSNMSDVRRIALEVAARHPQLDVLINNAGGVFGKREVTVDGFETTFAFNHLSPFLLTSLLLTQLKAAAESAGQARVVNVSSSANQLSRMRWNDLQFSTGYSGFAAYNQSKLMNVLFSNALARRLQGSGVEGSGVTSNALHPGIINTGFGKTVGGPLRALYWVSNLFAAISVQEGAQTSPYLATSPEADGVSGHYFVKQKAARANAVAYDQGAQDRLWALSEELLSKWLAPI